MKINNKDDKEKSLPDIVTLSVLDKTEKGMPSLKREGLRPHWVQITHVKRASKNTK